jgi:predicted RNA-binding protein YlxR (DUF448 family)
LPKRDSAPERRCIVTGGVKDRAVLVRFVVGPDGAVVPDVKGDLPGRGLWVTASRSAVEAAVAKRLFAKAARANVSASAGLADLTERLLARRTVELLGLANRAGLVAAGFEKARARLERGEAAALVGARDGAADGRRKLAALAQGIPVVEALFSAELDLALGRGNVIHAALAAGGLTLRFVTETTRLSGFRDVDFAVGAAGDEAT